MLDINLLRRDLPHVLERLNTRKSPQTYLDVNAFQAMEGERKTLQTHTEELQARRNSLSKQIGQRKSSSNSSKKWRDIQQPARQRNGEARDDHDHVQSKARALGDDAKHHREDQSHKK